MLLVGLGGSSRRQLHKVLALGDSESSTLKQDLHNLIVAVRSKSSGAIVQTATSAWLHKSLSVLPSYADDLKQVFESENTIVDYSNPQQAVDTINSWVVRHQHFQPIEKLFWPHVGWLRVRFRSVHFFFSRSGPPSPIWVITDLLQTFGI